MCVTHTFSTNRLEWMPTWCRETVEVLLVNPDFQAPFRSTHIPSVSELYATQYITSAGKQQMTRYYSLDQKVPPVVVSIPLCHAALLIATVGEEEGINFTGVSLIKIDPGLPGLPCLQPPDTKALGFVPMLWYCYGPASPPLSSHTPTIRLTANLYIFKNTCTHITCNLRKLKLSLLIHSLLLQHFSLLLYILVLPRYRVHCHPFTVWHPFHPSTLFRLNLLAPIHRVMLCRLSLLFLVTFAP